MRKAMIFASVVLALFQIWPMVFGHRAGSAARAAVAAATAPREIRAVATREDLPHLIQVSVFVPKSCDIRYRINVALCRAGDQACRLRTADQRDLCDATGVWPQ